MMTHHHRRPRVTVATLQNCPRLAVTLPSRHPRVTTVTPRIRRPKVKVIPPQSPRPKVAVTPPSRRPKARVTGLRYLILMTGMSVMNRSFSTSNTALEWLGGSYALSYVSW